MEEKIFRLREELHHILSDFEKQIRPEPGQILVVGCSTSEVTGQKIGTSGSMEVAAALFAEFRRFAESTGLELAFQCCEHLNRSLVVERNIQKRLGLEIVTVIPVPKAGGSMAATAYRAFDDPVVVEWIRADYGIDIGDTLIGMHLKPVAVPVRVSSPKVGHAHVILAKTRPKLIGGPRAVYSPEESGKY
jgi:conserved hypothetical protein TIGR01440